MDFRNKSIRQILQQIASGELTCEMVAKVCVDAYQKRETQGQAWVCFNGEGLLNEARQRDQNKPSPLRSLEGIPVAVKDVFNTRDFPTEMGSPIWKGFTPGNDARSLFHLKREGALIPGKTTTAEFAVHALNKTVNPHDQTRTPGTSSSGSAVAIAMGMVPVSVGTQTAGSIIRPASFCGIYGFKPSFGSIPRTGVLKTTDSLDTIGFFTARLEDFETVFDALRVKGPNYPFVHEKLDYPERQLKPEGRRWKVGFAKTHTWSEAPSYAQASMQDWVNKIAGFADVVVIDLPSEFERCHEAHEKIYEKALAYYFQSEIEREELISPVMREMIYRGREVTVEAYQWALKLQESLARKLDEILGTVDVLISLSTAGVAPRREVMEKPDPALMWTMAFVPVIGAPAFLSSEGLPFGAQIVARRYEDYRGAQFAHELVQRGLLPAGPNPLLPL